MCSGAPPVITTAAAAAAHRCQTADQTQLHTCQCRIEHTLYYCMTSNDKVSILSGIYVLVELQQFLKRGNLIQCVAGFIDLVLLLTYPVL